MQPSEGIVTNQLSQAGVRVPNTQLCSGSGLVFNLCKRGNGKREVVMGKVKTYLTFGDVNGISWICLEQALGLTCSVAAIKTNSKYFSAL